MSYEWAMTPINGLRISSDSKGINAINGDDIVSVSWYEVFRAINLYRDDMMADMMIEELESTGYLVM